jgi:hypothetical protein
MSTSLRYGRSFDLIGFAIALLILAVSLAPARAAEIPSDDEQDVLVRTTLMTFNDANMTGNYSVLLAKASKQFQSQVTDDKLAAAFEGFRTNELFFESVVADDYESADKAKIDSDGVLTLAGVFKDDDVQVKYRLRFVENGKVWKLLGINVDVKKL